MATSFNEIYSRFLPKIIDHSFLQLSSHDIENHLEDLLNASAVSFLRYCSKLSSKDNHSKTFSDSLTSEEIEILSILMCVEYLTPRLLTDDLLKQSMSTKDYNIHSQANHIRQVRELRDDYKKEANNLMILYTFRPEKMSEFR